MTDQTLDPEEVQEWQEWVPELLEAIELGMLDKHIKFIAKECYRRRDVLIERRDAKRKPKPGGASAPQHEGATTSDNPYKDMTLTPTGYTYSGTVHYNGENFLKRDIQRLYVQPHMFRFTSSKADGAEMAIVKVNRTNAVFQIKSLGWSRLGHGRGRIEVGDKINMPLTLLIKEAKEQTAYFHKKNGDSNA